MPASRPTRSWWRPRARSASRRSSRSAPTRARAARRWPRPSASTRSTPRSGTTPTRPPASATRTCRTSRELARHERCVAIGETGLDYFRDYAPRADQERAFAGQIELARATGKPLVIHTRAAEDDTIAMLKRDAGGLDVILHCFSMPDRWEECAERGLVVLVRRQRDLPEEPGPRVRRRQGAGRAAARGDRRAVPDAAGGPQGAQPAGVRRADRALRRAGARRSPMRSSTSRSRRMPPPCSGGERASHPAQPAPPAPVRRAAQARPGPELPDRLEHPRGDRARGRAGARRTSCSRSAVGWACSASTSRRAARTCMSSSSTARWSRRCATRSTRIRTRRCISPTR